MAKGTLPLGSRTIFVFGGAEHDTPELNADGIFYLISPVSGHLEQWVTEIGATYVSTLSFPGLPLATHVQILAAFKRNRWQNLLSIQHPYARASAARMIPWQSTTAPLVTLVSSLTNELEVGPLVEAARKAYGTTPPRVAALSSLRTLPLAPTAMFELYELLTESGPGYDAALQESFLLEGLDSGSAVQRMAAVRYARRNLTAAVRQKLIAVAASEIDRAGAEHAIFAGEESAIPEVAEGVFGRVPVGKEATRAFLRTIARSPNEARYDLLLDALTWSEQWQRVAALDALGIVALGASGFAADAWTRILATPLAFDEDHDATLAGIVALERPTTVGHIDKLVLLGDTSGAGCSTNAIAQTALFVECAVPSELKAYLEQRIRQLAGGSGCLAARQALADFVAAHDLENPGTSLCQ